jgi:hypothetical protein
VQVTGAIASYLCIGAAVGEMTLPIAISLLFKAEACADYCGPVSFLWLIFGANFVWVAAIPAVLFSGRSLKESGALIRRDKGEVEMAAAGAAAGGGCGGGGGGGGKKGDKQSKKKAKAADTGTDVALSSSGNDVTSV